MHCGIDLPTSGIHVGELQAIYEKGVHLATASCGCVVCMCSISKHVSAIALMFLSAQVVAIRVM